MRLVLSAVWYSVGAAYVRGKAVPSSLVLVAMETGYVTQLREMTSMLKASERNKGIPRNTARSAMLQ